MTYGTRIGGYPATSKMLHWLVAAAVLTTIPVAIVMGQVDSGAAQDALYDLHKSLGMLILVLTVLRLINRFVAGAPEPESGIEAWQRTVSSAVHGSLYVLVFTMAIVGYLANSTYGATTPFFGLFNVPNIAGKNEPLSEVLFAIHRWLGWILAVLVVMHAGAALYHHFVRRDNVLRRMLPRAIGGM